MKLTTLAFKDSTYGRLKRYFQERKFRRHVRSNRGKALKIVVGSSGIFQKEWIPSEIHFLNLLNEANWLRYFNDDEVDLIVAEHVWEHLTSDQGICAANTCFRFLRKGGNLRVAVPDGYHVNEEYITYVRPGGKGAGADDHKVLYNYQTLSQLFQQCGFEVQLLEYFDEQGVFHAAHWTDDKGFVRRSMENDPRNADGQPNYTSLIIDAKKPEV